MNILCLYGRSRVFWQACDISEVLLLNLLLLLPCRVERRCGTAVVLLQCYDSNRNVLTKVLSSVELQHRHWMAQELECVCVCVYVCVCARACVVCVCLCVCVCVCVIQNELQVELSYGLFHVCCMI
jgi:hypothetical protein